MARMKITLSVLCLALSACGSVGLQHSTPPKFAADATAVEIYEGSRAYADATDRKVFVHLGAPW